MDFLDRFIDEFEWSARCRGCFRNANILTLRDLTSRSAVELTGNKQFGNMALAEIRRVLNGLGLSLRNEDGDEDDAGVVRTHR
jgi:DNA-directed RNA polymerase subunit alpha